MINLTNEFNLFKVYLMLGEACNLECRHCIQHGLHRGCKKRISDETLRVIRHFCDIRPRGVAGVRDSIDINMFGGEPLLYMDTIKEFFERIERDNIKVYLVTNGTLITPEFVEFANEHEIGVNLSNDGRRTEETGRTNVLENPEILAMVKDLSELTIVSTLHAYNYDLYDLWDYIDEKFPEKKVPMFYETLRISFDEFPMDFVDYDFDKWKATCIRMRETLFHDFTADLRKEVHTREADVFHHAIDKYYRFVEGKATYPNCNSWKRYFNIDTDGNYWICHNGVDKFGNCKEEFAKVAKRAAIKLVDYRNRNMDECSQCTALPFCWMGCPVFTFNEATKKQCEFTRIFSSQVALFMQQVDNYFTTPIEL